MNILIAQNLSVLIFILLFITIILAKTHHDESSRFFTSTILVLIVAIFLMFASGDILLTITVILGYFAYVIFIGKKKYYDLKIRTKYIESDNLKDNFRALYISDFQFDQGKKRINEKAMKQVIDKINSQEYDMLLLGGDYINYTENIDIFFKYIKEINLPKMGAFAVLGNHDYVDYNRIYNEFEKLNFNVLENKRFDFNDEITIVGVEDVINGNPHLVELREDSLNILLTHNPNFISKLPKDNCVDFSLSGHYHAGQVNLLGIPIQRLISKYVYGFYNDYNTKMYVSSGVGGAVFRGMFTLQIRYFAQPEIVEVVFIGNKK